MELGETIDRVYVAGDGSNETILLPKYLPGGINYFLTVYSHMVSLSVQGYNREFEWKMLTSRVNGSDSGLRVSPGQVVNVMNQNGTIYLIGG